MEATLVLLGKLAASTVAILGVVYGIVSSMLKAHRQSFDEMAKEMRTASAAQASQLREELASAKSEHRDILLEAKTARAIATETREKQAVLEAQFAIHKNEVDRLHAKMDAVHIRIDKAEDARQKASEQLARELGKMTEAIAGLQTRKGTGR